MKTKHIALMFPFFFSTALLASHSEEKFQISCIASTSASDENLQAGAALTITERPATGTSLTFDYELLNLPYLAKVEIEFGENRNDDLWFLYFVDKSSSEKFGWTKATIAASENEVSIESKALNRLTDLMFSCALERMQ